MILLYKGGVMRNIIKIILLLTLITSLTSCTIFSNDYIYKTIELSNYNCIIESDIDTHSGFLGDGDHFAKIICQDIDYESLSKNWKKLPLTEPLNEITHLKQCDDLSCKDYYEKYSVPEITNGYYYFLDRHSESTNKYDDTDLNNRHSWNFTLGLFDKDTNTVYYYEFDT